jgi:hemerythrin-like domain-containing protein
MGIATKVKKAARQIEKAVTGETPEVDILDTLKEEHEMVSALLARLVDSDKPGERKSLVRQIKAALMPHIKAEQKVLYDALLAVRDKKAKQDGAEGYIEHALAERTLTDLGKLGSPLSPEFSATAKVLKELIAHHVREEESDLWSDAREHFESDERKAMNRRYLSEKKKVRVS